MSKPLNKPTVTVRRPRLRTQELSILAKEEKGKITGFEVRYREEPPEKFKVKGNKVLDAFRAAEKYAIKKLNSDAKTNGNNNSVRGLSGPNR